MVFIAEKYKLFHSFGLQLSVSRKTIALSFDNPNNMSNSQEDNEAIVNLQQRLMETRQILEQILVTKQYQVAMPTNISHPLIVIGSSHQLGVYHGVPCHLHSLSTRSRCDRTAS